MDRRMHILLWLLVVVVVVSLILALVFRTAPAEERRESADGGSSYWTREEDRRKEGHLPTTYDSTLYGRSKNNYWPRSDDFHTFTKIKYHDPPSVEPNMTLDCGCYVENGTAVCLDKLDNGIPPCVNSSITQVFISSQKVQSLPVNTFGNLSHLRYIDIRNTEIELLKDNLFHGTPDLKQLAVCYNKNLRYLDRDVFRGANNLEDVILGYNNIITLERDVFTHLTNLRKLNLQSNGITSLPEGIFRNNLELEELSLSDNPLHISTDVSRSLFRNNGKLRVLMMNGCSLQEVPPGLLSNAFSLEDLELGRNNISKFPAEVIQNCSKLGLLSLRENNLEVFDSEVLLQHGGFLSFMHVGDNPWRCDCDLVPLASWITLRGAADAAWCAARRPLHFLAYWFFDEATRECGGVVSTLRTDLGRVLSACRAIAEEPLGLYADEEVGFAAANHFLLAMAARTAADVGRVARRWAELLEDVLDRSGGNVTGSSGAPAAVSTRRRRGFQPLVNFTYVMMNIPESMTKEVDDGIKEELNILFVYIDNTDAIQWRADYASLTKWDSAGKSGSIASSESFKRAVAPPKKLNATEEMVFGLRYELREMLFTILKSIHQVKKNARFQH